MLESKKSSIRKRLGKFLRKMFWHFNQSVPNYSSTSMRRSSSKSDEDFGEQNNTILYPKQYRRTHRTSTLMSIQEENELDEFDDICVNN